MLLLQLFHLILIVSVKFNILKNIDGTLVSVEIYQYDD